MAENKPTYQELEERVKQLEAELEKQKQHKNTIIPDFLFEKYHKIFITNPSAMTINDIEDNNKFIDANLAFYELTGLQQDEVLGKTSKEIDLYQDISERDIALSILKRDGELRNFEFRYKFKNEKQGIGLLNVDLINIQNRKYAIISFTDITEIKTTQTALLQSEEKLQFIFDTMTEGVALNECIYNENGEMIDYKILEVNKAFYNVADYIGKEVIGNNATTIYAMSPDFIKAFWLQHHLSTKTTHTEYLSNYSKKWFKISTSPFINNRFVTTFHNITEQKTIELAIKKLSKAVECSKVAIFITDRGGRIEYANPFFTLLTGYKPQEYLGKTLSFLKSGHHSPEFYKEFWKTINSGDTWEGEFYNRKKTGELYWESAVISSIKNENNEITHFVAIKADINEKKTIINELVASKEKAEESNRLKTAFLNNMSHEIRTPLNAITGFSQLITNSNTSPQKLKRYTELIVSNSNKLIEIISDVIEISQIACNQINIRFYEFDLIKMMNEIAGTFVKIAKEKQLEFACNNDIYEDRFLIYSDMQKLKRIINHLIDNAIKFTTNGYIRISYWVKNDDVFFEIIDTGIGISSEMQKIIFEPFRQVEFGITRNYGGNGLGLSIAKAYIEFLSGKIYLKSEINQGTTVTLKIPVKHNFEIQQKQENKGNIKHYRTILIAEDEINNFLCVEELLLETKAKIVHARNGQEAVDFCRNNNAIDLVLMDIKMPIMDGHTATKLIKNFRPDIPVIALTAYALQSEIEQFIGIFDDYITKPIVANELNEKVIKYII